RRARRQFLPVKELAINPVERRNVTLLAEIAVALEDLCERAARSLHGRLDILERLLRLRDDVVADDLTIPDRDLPGYVNGIAMHAEPRQWRPFGCLGLTLLRHSFFSMSLVALTFRVRCTATLPLGG